MSRKPSRIVVVERELLVAGFGGTFRHRLDEPKRPWWRALAVRARDLVARVTRRPRR